MALIMRYAARSDVGLLREGNEDSGYASLRLLAVADGMGGAAAGEVASSVAIAAFARLDDDEPSGDLLALLGEALNQAQGQLSALVDAEPRLRGMGTTLTTVLHSSNRMGLLHVGDSRGYLLRAGRLERITRDHTLVQSLIDAGQLSESEAQSHPQRSVITRTLDGAHRVEPDLSVREVKAGDRILLCSDGLSGVVSQDTLADTLTEHEDPGAAADALVALALRGGGPDNVTCVVADFIEEQPDDGVHESRPEVVGAVGVERNTRRLRLPDTPAGRAAQLTSGVGDGPVTEGQRSHRKVLILAVLATLVLGIGVGGAIGWYAWAQKQYYVAATDENGAKVVAVYRGPAEQLFGLQLSKVVEASGIAVIDLPEFQQDELDATIPARSLDGARQIVTELATEAAKCVQKNPPAGCPDAA